MTEIRQIDKQTDTQTVINECKNRQLGQWKRTEELCNRYHKSAGLGCILG